MVPNEIHVFGLTGGIASGKSSVADHFRRRGLSVLDADQLARTAVQPGSAGLKEIAQRFGSQFVLEGHLDRPALAQLVFGNPEALASLNAIVHPKVAQLRVRQFQQWQDEGKSLACYEVPLLFETGLHSELKPVVLVSLKPEKQLRRGCLRDSSREAALQARISAQMPLENKERLANFIIDNNGSLDSTYQQADRVLSQVFRFFELPPIGPLESQQ